MKNDNKEVKETIWVEGAEIECKYGKGRIRKISHFGVHCILDKDNMNIVFHFNPTHHKQANISELRLADLEVEEPNYYEIGDFHPHCDDGCKHHCTKGNTQKADCLLDVENERCGICHSQLGHLPNCKNSTLKTAREVKEAIEQEPYLQELFNYLSNELGVTALLSQMQDIVEIANKESNSDTALSEAIEIINELVQVKDWKDEYSKDEHYLKAQPIVWKNAKDFLYKHSKQ